MTENSQNEENKNMHPSMQSIEEIYEQFESSKKGLSQDKADEKIEELGLNELPQKKEKSLFKLFIEQFQSVLIIMLLVAVGISFLLHEVIDGIIILVILMLNAGIGFFQELSARKSLSALKEMQKGQAKVYRDNELITIPSRELVVGDIIFCESGDKVPADCRIIELTRLQVEESQLTGESTSVSKELTVYDEVKTIGDQKNMIFKSTNVSSGNCLAIVVATGIETEIGKISKSLQEQSEELTPLQKKLDKFGKQLGTYILLICMVLLAVSALQENLFTEFSLTAFLPLLLVAVALAVAAVPEGLPAVVTITLSLGMKKLLHHKALVRNLSSVETLGSCTIICSDKTGTLTKNEMTITHINTPDTNEIEVHGKGYVPVGEFSKEINNIHFFNCMNLCNTSTLFKKDNIWQITGDPTEAALLVATRKQNHSNSQEENNKIDEIPFDSSRKLMSTMHEINNETIQYTKGAIDELLQISTKILEDGKEITLTDDKKKEILKLASNYSNKALRVLAMSYKKTTSNKCLEEELVYLGMVAMIDPPRDDAKEAIHNAKTAGIRTIMITGDHITTATAIAHDLGIEGDALKGTDIDELDDEELRIKLQTTSIFARVSPHHKMRLVNILQDEGEVVAMTGDGVNDAPALKKADIGVALGSGTDVAKEASDIVLLNDSFASITHAIREGRVIFTNIQKSLLHLLSGNASEVMIIFLAALFGLPLPLTAFMLLWINLITDGAPALAMAVDPASKDIMKQKPNRQKGIMSKKLFTYMISLSLLTTALALPLFYTFQENLELAQTLLFTFIVGVESLIVFLVRMPYGTEAFSNKWMTYAISISLLLQAIIIYTPLNQLFGLTPLGLLELVVLLVNFVIFFSLGLVIKMFMFPKFEEEK